MFSFFSIYVCSFFPLDSGVYVAQAQPHPSLRAVDVENAGSRSNLKPTFLP